MRRVRIRRAHGKTVAPLHGRTVDLGAHDFIVVTGPNESGKSTLADLLSWVLAGRRSDHAAGLRLASFPSADTVTVDVDASIEGTVDGLPFEIDRTFKIRRRPQGKQPAEPEPTIRVDGKSLTNSAWASTIGIDAGDDYFRNYRITGPYDSDNAVNIRQLLESLAIGISATTSPKDVLDALRKRADSLVPPPEGRLTEQRLLKAPTDALAEARTQQQQAASDERSIDTLRASIDALDEARRAMDVERDEIVTEKAAHETARRLLSARIQQAEAQGRLDALPDLPNTWAGALAQVGQLDLALTHLESAETDAAGASTDAEKARHIAGLSTQQMAALAVEKSDVDAVTALDTQHAAALAVVEQAREALPEMKERRVELVTRLEALATSLDCSADQLRSFAAATNDDAAFNDPIKNWSDAEARAAACAPPLEAARGRQRDAVSARDDIERRWAATGEVRSPEAVLEGGHAPAGPAADTRDATWRVAAAAVAVAGLAAVRWWLGLIAAAAVVAAVAALRRRPSTNSADGVAASPDHIELARSLIESRRAVAAADEAVRIALEALTREEGLRSGSERHALQVLSEYGFPAIDRVERAMRLRAERSTIASITGSIDELDRKITDLDIASTAARAAIDSIGSEVAAIAERIGAPHLGRHLDAASAAALWEAMLARRRHESALGALDRRQSDLRSLLADLPADFSASGVRIDLVQMTQLRDQRNALATTIAEAAAALGAASERAVAILANPGVSEELLDLRIGELASRIAELSERLDAALEDRGSLGHQLDAITKRSDLAAINQAIDQAEAEQRRVAVEGAAWWVAHRIVSDVKDEVEANQQPELIRRASELAKRITDGHWQSISTDDEGNVIVRQGAAFVLERSLSAGARDVLRLVVRLAAAEAHSDKTGVSLPVILDDPTASVDSVRAPRLFEVLAEFATGHQVIVMTHDEQTIAQAIAVGAIAVPVSGS